MPNLHPPRVPDHARPLPRIKLDLTADERLVLPPVRIPIFHPYSDAPDDGIEVLAYAYEEAFGEKVTAQIDATHRDIADMCFVCFQALGRDR